MPRRTHGGTRSKAGRKPIEDKKIPITIYLRKSVIETNGGTEEVKEKLTAIFPAN